MSISYLYDCFLFVQVFLVCTSISCLYEYFLFVWVFLVCMTIFCLYEYFLFAHVFFMMWRREYSKLNFWRTHNFTCKALVLNDIYVYLLTERKDSATILPEVIRSSVRSIINILSYGRLLRWKNLKGWIFQRKDIASCSSNYKDNHTFPFSGTFESR